MSMPNQVKVDEELTLKLLESADAEAIWSILQGDPSIKEYVWWVQHAVDVGNVRVQLADAKRWLTPYGIWDGDKLVGYIGSWDDVGYFDGIKRPGVKSMGYFVGKGSRGKGVTVRAAKALMGHLERNNMVNSYRVFAEDSNTASAIVLQKLGFTRTDETFTDKKNGWVERLWIKNNA